MNLREYFNDVDVKALIYVIERDLKKVEIKYFRKSKLGFWDFGENINDIFIINLNFNIFCEKLKSIGWEITKNLNHSAIFENKWYSFDVIYYEENDSIELYVREDKNLINLI